MLTSKMCLDFNQISTGFVRWQRTTTATPLRLSAESHRSWIRIYCGYSCQSTSMQKQNKPWFTALFLGDLFHFNHIIFRAGIRTVHFIVLLQHSAIFLSIRVRRTYCHSIQRFFYSSVHCIVLSPHSTIFLYISTPYSTLTTLSDFSIPQYTI
jgi:uncharacterized membrane protein